MSVGIWCLCCHSCTDLADCSTSGGTFRRWLPPAGPLPRITWCGFCDSAAAPQLSSESVFPKYSRAHSLRTARPGLTQRSGWQMRNAGLVCFLPGVFLLAAGFIKRCDPHPVAGPTARRTFRDASKVRLHWGSGEMGGCHHTRPSELVTRVTVLVCAPGLSGKKSPVPVPGPLPPEKTPAQQNQRTGPMPCSWLPWRDPRHVRVWLTGGQRGDSLVLRVMSESQAIRLGWRSPRRHSAPAVHIIPSPRAEPAWEGWDGDLGAMTLSWPCRTAG